MTIFARDIAERRLTSDNDGDDGDADCDECQQKDEQRDDVAFRHEPMLHEGRISVDRVVVASL